MSERPISEVPGLVSAVLAAALALQIGFKAMQPALAPGAADLPEPPSTSMLRLASFGDAIPPARILMLYLQSYDYRADNQIRYQAMDYDRLQRWLGTILWLDPGGQYPLLAASRLYAEVPDPARQRKMLDFIYGQFLADPENRWPWLAHAAVLAKHRLHDLGLARRYAAAIQRHAKGPRVPLWAKEMEIFILEDMNELETARIMIGGFLDSGSIKDPVEVRFLDQRLKEIEARIQSRPPGFKN